MSWLMKKRNQVFPSRSTTSLNQSSTESLSPSQLNRAIRDILDTTDERSRLSDICGGNPITEYGKRKQLFKIISIVMIPVALLTGLTGNTFINTFTNYAKSSEIRATLLYSVKLGTVIHYLQEERDISALYLIKVDTRTKSMLLERYAETDKALENLTIWTTGPTLIREEFQSKGRFFSYLNKHRYELDSLNQTVTMELQMYTTLIRVFITWLYDAITEEVSGSIWRSLVAYQEIIIAKEYMGLERALGTIFYISGKFMSIDVYLWFTESLDVTKSTFLSAGRYSDLVHKLYNRKIKGNKMLLHILSQMRAKIRRNDMAGRGSITNAQYWFGNMTLYMKILLETQNELTVEIIEMLDVKQQQNIRSMLGISFVLVIVLFMCPMITCTIFSLTSNLQKYSITLVERGQVLNKERGHANILLYQMLPKSVADILKRNEDVNPEIYSEATVMFSDVQGFTKISAQSSAVQMVQMLNSLYTLFDECISHYDVYKVETIGDAYMVVSGVPKPNGTKHVSEISTLALSLLNNIRKIDIDHLPGTSYKLRIGCHTGSVVAAVVGYKMPRYCVFGESVSIAAKIEALGEPGRIHISNSTHEALVGIGGFTSKLRKDSTVHDDNELQMFMKSFVQTYWLTGKQGLFPASNSQVTLDSSSSSNSTDSELDQHQLGKMNRWSLY